MCQAMVLKERLCGREEGLQVPCLLPCILDTQYTWESNRTLILKQRLAFSCVQR